MICDPWSTTLFELDTFFIRQHFFSLALTTLHTVPASRWTILIFPPCEITISPATMKKSFFAKTKWPKFSLWSADITLVTTAKLRKMYNNLWQNYGEAIYHVFFPVETVCIPNNIWRRRMCWCSRCKWQWRKQRRKRISIDERTNEAKPASKLRGT